jgi:hypothetical protein
VGRIDCGKMRGLVSKRRSSQMRGKRVGSQEAVYQAGRRRGHARERLKLRGGVKQAPFGRRRGPAQISTRNDVGTRFDLGEQDRPDPGLASPRDPRAAIPMRVAGSKAGPGPTQPSVRYSALGEANDRTCLGPEAGPQSGAMAGPERDRAENR